MPSCGKVATSTVFHSIWRISVWQPPVLQGGSVAVRFPCKSSGVLPWLSQWEKDLLGDREWAMHIDFQLNAALVYPFFFWFSRTCKGATIWCCSATTYLECNCAAKAICGRMTNLHRRKARSKATNIMTMCLMHVQAPTFLMSKFAVPPRIALAAFTFQSSLREI